MSRLALLLALCLASAAAHAQTVYRCGSEYTQTPCPQGRVVDATDPRSAAQRAEARRVAADERRLASQMQRDRLAEEAAIQPKGAGSLSGAALSSAKLEVQQRPPKKKRVVVKRVKASKAPTTK